MTARCLDRATLPALAVVVVAFAIGLALLSILLVFRMELMTSGLQYLCAEGGPQRCFVSAAQATTVSKAPLVFFTTFVVVPAFLAILAPRILKTLPSAVARWGVLAMWFAAACYVCVPILSIYFSAPFSAKTSETGWALYQPLSRTTLPAHLAGTPNALQMNALTLVVLLILIFSSSTFLTWRQERTKMSKVARSGGVAFICATIWMMITNLGSLVTMVSLDRNFGTTFFDPAAKAQKSVAAQIVEYLATPAVWCAIVLISCVVLWILVRQITRSQGTRLKG